MHSGWPAGKTSAAVGASKCHSMRYRFSQRLAAVQNTLNNYINAASCS